MATRWRMPPDRSLGKRSRKSRSCSICQQRVDFHHDLRLGLTLELEPECDIVGNGHPREKGIFLEDHARSGPGAVHRSPLRELPAVGREKPAIAFSSVDLPQPDGPSRQTNSP